MLDTVAEGKINKERRALRKTHGGRTVPKLRQRMAPLDILRVLHTLIWQDR